LYNVGLFGARLSWHVAGTPILTVVYWPKL
jgi:hypothetical protein